ncbi:MAG: HAD-IA family hydrolase, partial [Bacteroidales bacterium]|nr:HAD-IA family hydrolase [Bacteroidales bacterium]
ILLTRYGLTPSECVFIDDNAYNVKAAEEMGIKGIQLISREQMTADLEKILHSSID